MISKVWSRKADRLSNRRRLDSFSDRFKSLLYNLASDIDRLYANLSIIPNYEVYKKSQIPEEYHYRSNVRIGGK